MPKNVIDNELKKVSESFEAVNMIEKIIENIKSKKILGVTFCTETEEFNLKLNENDAKEWITYLKAYKFHKKSIGTSSAKSAELLITNL